MQVRGVVAAGLLACAPMLVWGTGAQAREALPFNLSIPDPTLPGMAGAARSSIDQAGTMLRQAVPGLTTPQPAQGQVQEQAAASTALSGPPRAPARLGALGTRPAPAALQGSMEEGLAAIIRAQMGEEACPAVASYGLMKGGAGFWADCGQGAGYTVRRDAARSVVAACAIQVSEESGCASP